MNVIPLFTDETTPLLKMLPASAILPFVQRAERAAAGPNSWDVGRHALGRLLADRVGGSPESWVRQLERLKSGKTTYLYASFADKLSIGLGLHPGEIWPDLWFRFSHEVAV